MSLRNLTIGLRASLFFALMTLLMVALGGFALLQMQRMHSYSDEVDKNWLPAILASNDIGLATSRVRTIEIGEHAVLLVDRFDRVGKVDPAAPDPTAGELRIPYWSARTATGDGRDYLDVARVIRGMDAPRDVIRAQLRDLWRREGEGSGGEPGYSESELMPSSR